MKKKTVFALIVDRSGSMFDISDEIRQSLNERIKSIKKIAKDSDREVIVELVIFNHGVNRIRSFENANNIKKLKRRDYEINGTTALYDALGSTLERIDLKYGKEIEEKLCNAVVVVYTDGYENSSRHFSNDDIKEHLSKANKMKGFEVTLVGCDEDTLTMARNMNFKGDNIVRTVKNRMGESMAEMDCYFRDISNEKDVSFKSRFSKFDLDKE